MKKPKRWFSYEGKIYVRPVGRGICLGPVCEDSWQDWGQLEDTLARFALGGTISGYPQDGYAQVRILFEVLDG